MIIYALGWYGIKRGNYLLITLFLLCMWIEPGLMIMWAFASMFIGNKVSSYQIMFTVIFVTVALYYSSAIYELRKLLGKMRKQQQEKEFLRNLNESVTILDDEDTDHIVI